ncbi:alpha/beta hydrolase [Cupriavidus basilensis]|uniref:alpha/beta hydrolase n=1 Tax=Cupriavidus basilensis TaxID=68895 RepID=UPI003F5C2959
MRMAMKAAGLALWLGGLLPCPALAALQDQFLYFPAKAALPELVAGGLEAWPSSQDFKGLVAEPTGAVHATAIVFHGNAGHAGHRSAYAAALAPQGVRVILAEYPGYGPRPGSLGEASLVADAEQIIARAYRQYGAPLLVIGESLGAGVAAAAAAHQRDKTAGLMLITPWDTLQHVAGYHYPWLPVSWLLRDRYDSAANLARFAQPVVVVVAERDSIVPARFGVALHDGLAAPRQLRVVPGAEHNDWFERVDGGWWRDAVRFLLGGAD